MTNKEALAAVLQVALPDNSLEKAMIDEGITGSATYTVADAKSIDLCAITLLSGILSSPNISEGGFSISFDRASVKERLLLLARKHNVTEIINQVAPKPTVKSVRPW